MALYSKISEIGIITFIFSKFVDIMQLNDMVSENEKKIMLSELNANWPNLTARHLFSNEGQKLPASSFKSDSQCAVSARD